MSLLSAHMAVEMLKGLADSPTKASTGRRSVAGDARRYVIEEDEILA